MPDRGKVLQVLSRVSLPGVLSLDFKAGILDREMEGKGKKVAEALIESLSSFSPEFFSVFSDFFGFSS